jgi:hypothetical protein
VGQENKYCTAATQSLHKKVALKRDMCTDLKTHFVDFIKALDQEQKMTQKMNRSIFRSFKIIFLHLEYQKKMYVHNKVGYGYG